MKPETPRNNKSLEMASGLWVVMDSLLFGTKHFDSASCLTLVRSYGRV
jgi:hypothetical protein